MPNSIDTIEIGGFDTSVQRYNEGTTLIKNTNSQLPKNDC